MPTTRLAVLSFALLAGLGAAAVFAEDAAIVIDPSIAGMSADQKVAARQEAMKTDGKILRGSGSATGADAVKIATTVLQNMTNFPALFADGATNSKSKALPVVWQQFDDFSGLFGKGQETAKAMLAAAKSGDSAGWQTSLKTMAGLCGDCHQQYREPL